MALIMFILQELTDVWDKGIFLNDAEIGKNASFTRQRSRNKLRQEVGHASLSHVRSWGFRAGPFEP